MLLILRRQRTHIDRREEFMSIIVIGASLLRDARVTPLPLG
jgi:hypothetical protein